MKHSYRFYTIMGCLLVVSELWKQYTLTFVLGHGIYNWWYLPVQLCSIPMYVCLMIGITAPRSEHIASLLMAYLMNFGLLGGIFAFFDTSGMHYGYAPLTIHSFAWHILLIIIGCYSGLNQKAAHSFEGYRFSVILYLACCCLATVCNLTLDRFGTINMFYINPHYHMNQVVFREIADHLGNPMALLLYILASIAGAGIFHILWNILSQKKAR